MGDRQKAHVCGVLGRLESIGLLIEHYIFNEKAL